MSQEIERAAELLRAGRLVAFPTETVYGLGANALDPAAVQRIFEAKGRPLSSPLIVHVDSIGMARELALQWPDAAEKLARRFWPGPLTIVLPKQPVVPDIVTASLPSVGLRIPAHPVAIALLQAAKIPLAAPSANRFMELSPTTAEHVRIGLGDEVDMILDGGPCSIGIESTVISFAGPVPKILRPGMISQPDIEAAARNRPASIPATIARGLPSSLEIHPRAAGACGSISPTPRPPLAPMRNACTACSTIWTGKAWTGSPSRCPPIRRTGPECAIASTAPRANLQLVKACGARETKEWSR
jgi:tRNA threonylcarbamoyl adenosine modification protein (Sua5/YciO/YrdC/YwlC family)